MPGCRRRKNFRRAQPDFLRSRYMNIPMIFSVLKTRVTYAAMFLALLCVSQAFPQTTENWDRSSVNRTKAIDPARSRAAQAADEMVSLSAEKIIALLRNETGLMLQVKKVLVQKAYEQGRIVDA